MEDLAWKAAPFILAQVIAMSLAYFHFRIKIAYLEGSVESHLDAIEKRLEKLDSAYSDMEQDVSIMDRAQIKTSMDVNASFEKIRRLEEHQDRNNAA